MGKEFGVLAWGVGVIKGGFNTEKCFWLQVCAKDMEMGRLGMRGEGGSFGHKG
jgi:hypothetical protein